jgi:hypothetical protein
VLVPAVFRPEQGEDRQLEVVRLALQEFADALELFVREPERAMQGLFSNLRQKPILAGGHDGQGDAGSVRP